MARRNQPAAQPTPSPSVLERQEEQEMQQSESNFLNEALSELPPLETKRPPGHEDPPDDDLPPGETQDAEPAPELKAPKPATKAAPVKPTVQPPAKTPVTEPKPPTEIPPADKGESKTKDTPVDQELEDRLSKIVPKNTQEEKGFAALKGLIRETNAKVKVVETTLAEKEKALKELETKILPETDVNDLRALREYVQHTAIKDDPAFQRKYDQKLQSVNADAIDLLTKVGMDASIAETIAKEGGLLAFSQSQKTVDVAGTPMTHQEYFDKFIFGGLKEATKMQLSSIMAKGHSIEREKEQEIADAVKNAPEFFSAKQKEAINRFNTEAGARMKELIAEMPEDLPREIVQIPEDASPEEKERLTAQNADFKEADEYISKMAYANAPKDKAEVAFYAALGKFLLKRHGGMKEQIESLTKRATDAEEQLEGIRNSQSMGRRRSAPPVPAQKDQRSDTELTDEEAMKKYL